ncbi:MAG: class I SAM-dependent methyltransferase, partial [Hyphococcus sp.]
MPKLVSYVSRHTPRGVKNVIGGPLRALIGAAAASDNLEQLGIKHSTDKLYHGYLPHYQRHFASRRESAQVVLEIGVGGFDDPQKGGESLRMWADYFPNAHIHGVDIIDKSAHDGPRMTTHKGSQNDQDFLRGLISRIGTPDVIIDDGSHVNEHILTSFKTLFPLLAKTGVYVIEDMQTAYLPDAGGDFRDLNNPATSAGFAKT